MKIGGYQIIDLENNPLTSGSGAVVIDGIYSTIESTNKTIMVSGVIIDNVEYNDTYVEFTEDGSNYVGVLYGYELTIQDNDVVSVNTAPQNSVPVVAKNITLSGTSGVLYRPNQVEGYENRVPSIVVVKIKESFSSQNVVGSVVIPIPTNATYAETNKYTINEIMTITTTVDKGTTGFVIRYNLTTESNYDVVVFSIY